MLGPDDVVRALADECYGLTDGEWHPVSPMDNLRKASDFHAVRRRIPAKPEAMEIDDPSGKMNVNVRDDGSVLVEQEWPGDFPDFVAIDTVDSIRKLSQWLAQVADWREAQDAAK